MPFTIYLVLSLFISKPTLLNSYIAEKSCISEIGEIINSNMKNTIKVLGNKSRAPQFIIKGIAPEYTQREPETLIEQFKKLNNIPECAYIKHKTFLNLKSGDKHWIIETDGVAAKILLNLESVYL